MGGKGGSAGKGAGKSAGQANGTDAVAKATEMVGQSEQVGQERGGDQSAESLAESPAESVPSMKLDKNQWNFNVSGFQPLDDTFKLKEVDDKDVHKGIMAGPTWQFPDDLLEGKLL